MRSEFEFLENLKKHFNLSKLGDDCAVLPKDSETDLLVTVDMLVEDIDFRLDWTSPKYLGHKALAVSLSDIFAMGGTPNYSLVSMGIPEDVWNTDFVDEFYIGYKNLAKKYEVELVGGDISKTPEKFVIDSVVLGEVSKGKGIMRSTANPGDIIFVSGTVGGASAGLKLLEDGVRYEDSITDRKNALILRQLAPFPAGIKGFSEVASSMIDISDGLSSDLSHICQASGVGAKIDADKVPFDENLSEFTTGLDEQLELALNGGEDFELLFTVNPKHISDEILRGSQQIGEITESVGQIELIQDGRSEILKPKGFTHF